ncbi:MAG: twin-arginine translocase TatA/TatE family subunit [Candidatus Promineifilaceae bacterium]|nr:twin-arginine translocase TatA/TatE family subunit [Anaerolineaceae bacterium]
MDSFFGIGFPELILILIVAGIVMGPERIGVAARWLGRTTAQLQKISRGFVRQLNQELDSSGDGQAIKETMQELQKLRKELTDLRGEVTQTSNDATKAGRQAFADINNSIKPPAMKPPTVPPASAAPANGKVNVAEAHTGAGDKETNETDTAVPPLPSLLEVPDDPE